MISAEGSSLTPLSGVRSMTDVAEVAQVVEHATENRGVGSSTLPLGTNGKIGGHSAIEHRPDRIIYPPPSARRAGVAQG